MASHLVKELQEFYVRVDSQSGELVQSIRNTGNLHTFRFNCNVVASVILICVC